MMLFFTKKLCFYNYSTEKKYKNVGTANSTFVPSAGFFDKTLPLSPLPLYKYLGFPDTSNKTV